LGFGLTVTCVFNYRVESESYSTNTPTIMVTAMKQDDHFTNTRYWH